MNADETQMNAGNLKALKAWELAWMQGPGDSGFLSALSSAFIRASSAFICVLRRNRERAK
jgi:hypothetical protein